MKIQIKLILFLVSIHFVAIFAGKEKAPAKLFLFLGETGSGKSTSINQMFGGDAATGDFESITQKCDFYPWQKSGWNEFEDSIAMDSPGLFDTYGKSDKEILKDMESQVLHASQSFMLGSHIDEISAIFIVVDPSRNKNHFAVHLASYLSMFSESLHPSLVVILNKRQNMDQEHYETFIALVQAQANHAASKDKIKPPVIGIDMQNPSKKDKQKLIEAVKNVKPYKFKNFDEKKEEIQKIYDELLNDAANYKNETEKIVEEVTTEVLKHIVVKKAKEVRDQVVVSRRGFSFFGFSFGGGSKIKDVIRTIEVDEVVQVKDWEKKPEIREQVRKVLKNEVDVYWQLAVEKYAEKMKGVALGSASFRPKTEL